MSSEIIIGMDGGGSGCRVAIRIGDRRQEARGGPANVWQDEAGAVANLAAALDEAAQAL
ncbi:N-acetylglucosamine kinase, partial [Aquicoccus sp. SCR17]|nr:N-acetylglucosamine kinase [Carideicomes alvinocaridis]